MAGYASIVEKAGRYDLTETIVAAELREFERRQVLENRNGVYSCKVRLFGRWLKEIGLREIITTFSDLTTAMALKKEEEEAYIQSKEILDTIRSWGIYRGRSVSEDSVRTWLGQFGSNRNQRMMFSILQQLRFYSADRIRAKMHEAHGIVVRGLVRRLSAGTRKRADILVSYLDELGKSGAYCAKVYADENEIYTKNIVEKSKISRVLKENDNIQALVFIDDFVGSGDSVSRYFAELFQQQPDVFHHKTLRICLVAVCGFQDALVRIEQNIAELGITLNLHICDPLDDQDRCFSENSRFFQDPNEKERAKEVAHRHGVSLVKNAPLGYGNCQSAVIFEDSSPNNNLPILWSDNHGWTPLFRRQ
jgi:hypothetical protein